MIERLARDPEADIARLERLAVRDFHNAIAVVQADLDPVRTDCKNDQTKSKYASLAAADAVLRPVFTWHGFSVSFDTEHHHHHSSPSLWRRPASPAA